MRSLGHLRVVVITAGQFTGADLPPDIRHRLAATWLSLQTELAHLSTDNVHLIALRSDHFVQSFVTGQPSVVTGAVRAVVRAAREGRPLPPCARLFHGRGVRCV